MKYSTAVLAILLCTSLSYAQPLSGTYTIGGSAPSYTKIADAVSDLATKGVAGPVIFNIRSGQYNERFTIPQIAGASSVNTITFQAESGNAANVRIYGMGSGFANDHHVIKLSGADHIIFRKLTIENTGITFASVFHITDKADFNTIEECILLADSTPDNNANAGVGVNANYIKNYIGIIVATGTPQPLSTTDISEFLVPGNNCNNLSIKNNTISGSSYSVVLLGSGSSGRDTGNVVSGNKLSNCYNMGIQMEGINKGLIENNRVVFSPAANAAATGLYMYSCNKGTIKKNYTRGAIGYGIRIVLVEGLIANNFVAGGNRPNNAGYGLSCVPGGNISTRIYNNSILFDAPTATGSAFYCFNSLGKMELKNNIFYHSGGGYAASFQKADPNKNLQLDYNNYFSRNAAGVSVALAKWETQDCADLDAFRAVTQRDQNSMSVNPEYVSGTDLHTLSPNLDLKGLSLPEITDDIDGQPRNPRFPDIGADEYIIKLKDIGILDIGPDYPVTGTNYVTVTLVNDGLSSLKDSVISLSYSTDKGITWSAPETYTINSLQASYATETYTFQAPWIINSVTSFDVCVRINSPGLLSDINKTNDSFCKRLCTGMQGGTFTVGNASSDFPSLAAVQNYLLNAVCELQGPLVFNIAPGTYNEKLQVPYLKGSSETNTITFSSASGNPSDVTISSTGSSGEVQHYTIQLNGANHTIIENLSIINTGEAFGSGIHLTNNAANNTIRNCHIVLDSVLKVGYNIGIVCSDTAILQGESTTHNNSFIGNTIRGGSAGIRIYGKSNRFNNGLIVSGNRIESVNDIGISALNTNFREVNNNYVVLSDSSDISIGLYFMGSKSDATISGNYVSNAGISGIRLENINSPLQCLFSNNMVGGGYRNADEGYGVHLTNTDNLMVYHNTILYDMTNMPGSAALFSQYGDNVQLMNNIFMNTGQGYALKVMEPATVAASDNNDLYTNGQKLAYWVEDRETLADLQAASGLDQASVSVDAGLISAQDLHATASEIDGKATFLANVAVDFDGELRNSSAPDMGADEFSIGIDGGVSGFNSPETMMENESMVIKITLYNYGTISLSNVPVKLLLDEVQVANEVFSGTILPSKSAEYSFTWNFTPAGPGVYTFKAFSEINSDINLSNDTAVYSVDVIAEPLSVTAYQQSSLFVYPNPASDYLQIRYDSELPLQHAAICDIFGRLILEIDPSANTVDLAHLTPGLYILKAGDEQTTYTRKFVIR